MRLSDRLKDPQIAADRPAPKRLDVTAPTALADFKASVQQALYARLGTELFDSSLSPAQLTAQVSQEITSLMDSSTVPLSIPERQELAAAVVNDVVGLGPIEQFLADPDVSEVMVNALDPIYVERRGVIERTEAQFMSVDTPPSCRRSHRWRRRPPNRRIVTVGRREAARRFARQRHRPAARRRRAGADDPQVRRRSVPGRRPGVIRHPHRRTGRTARRSGQSRSERPRVGWHRYRQDDAAQRVVELHPRFRAHRDHRSTRWSCNFASAMWSDWRAGHRTSRAGAR